MASLTKPWLVLLLAMGCTFLVAAHGGSGNPTAGFEKVKLTAGDFQVQSPFNVPERQRFQYRNGVRTFWVHRNDKPFNTATHTNPRSEVRLRIHNQEGAAHSTVLMLHVYDGVLRFYSGTVVEPDIYNRWFRLNVVHDVRASTVAVYVDDKHKFGTSVTPSESYYFKFGVYMQHHDQSSCMESRWSNVTLYTKH
uniref:Alginate lyase 2 domain-containing protein n=1 Tax=Aegilops tauschii TaxID=37682 RepID=R7W925_AEGTA